jgi:hypothetical protein
MSGDDDRRRANGLSSLSLPLGGVETSEALFLIPPPLVGRVAHRERSEGCDGWGASGSGDVFASALAADPTRLAFGQPPSP